MKILCIGDIVGEPGRMAVRKFVPELIINKGIDFVVANAENAAGGSGITPQIADELLSYGVDVITTGDHIWKKKEIQAYVTTSKHLLRPANYPNGAPGSGSTVVESRKGVKVGVINLIGRTFMEPVDSPFTKVLEEIKSIKDKASVIIVDIHAEATSEKIALSYHMDGKVSAIFGTHTHVQTADEKILPGGTGYITDCGMTGPFDGVIGRKKEQILERFITQLPTKFEVAEGDIRLNGVIFTVNEKTGQAEAAERIDIKL